MSLITAPPTPPGSGADEVVTRIKAVTDALAALADLPVWALDDTRLDARVASAAQLAASAQEMLARTVGEADTAGVAQRAGASSTRAWLTSRHGMSVRAAAQTLRQARAMTPKAEPTRLAWARGEIDGEQAQMIGHAINELAEDISPHRVEAAQRDLIEHAQKLTVRELQRVANRLVEVVDPDGSDRILGEKLAEQEKRAYEQSVFRLTKGVDGVARFSGRMPNLTADMLLTNLQALASPRRDHLRDDETGPTDDGQPLLPYGNRLGRAFCELVEKISERDLPSDGVNATLVVTVDEQTLRDAVGSATLSSGDDLSVSEARRLACNVDIIPAVLDSDSRPLDVGRRSRLFDRSQRIALAVRDGNCVFPSCDRPPGWTEAHHVVPWAAGGKTDLSNGTLLCGFHHRLVHRDDGWEIRVAADGVPEIIPPERIDPHRRPVRHQRHRQRSRPRTG